MPSVSDLTLVLAGRAGFDVVDVQPSDNQIRLVGRVPPNASSQWVLIIHRLLVVSTRTPWKVDISRHYFLRSVGSGQEKLFYAWRLIFQGPQVQTHLKSIMDTINAAPRPARVELAEFPLHGSQRNHVNGKGAYAAETTPGVVHAAAAARMGGQR